jgi:enoyl reductase
MAKAVVFSEFGGPEVLHLIDLENPAATSGEVRVRVCAGGVSPFDCKLRRGKTDFVVRFPQRVGNEFSGIVDQVGPDVPEFAAGDEVLGFTVACSHAERIVVPANQVVLKPPNLSWDLAAGLSVVGQGAFNYMDQLAIGGGDTVLIHAAAGGVGTIAVQLAILRGARVVGTGSERNHDYLRSLGAIPVTYGEGMVERVRALVPTGIDVALDCVGGAATEASIELVGNRQRIGVLIDAEAAIARYGVRRLTNIRTAEKLRSIVHLFAEGKLHLPVKTYPLSAVVDAHREVEAGHVRGKIVLIVA